ncbi:MAG: hypothetical protein ACYTFK_13215 [Planctomycetota bacterium]|jgi:hypothetical protein
MAYLNKYWVVGDFANIWHYNGSWSKILTGITGYFFAIKGTNDENVWAVGTKNTTWPHNSSKPLVAYYDGKSWKELTNMPAFTDNNGYADY